MSGEQLSLRPFQSGQYTFAGIEQAGLVYRFSPVERRDIITIGSLKKNEPKEIDLSTQLQHDILVTGISADIVGDDSHEIQKKEKPRITTTPMFKQFSNYWIETIEMF